MPFVVYRKLKLFSFISRDLNLVPSFSLNGLTEGKKKCPGKRIFEKEKLSLTGTTNLYKSIYFGTFVNISYKAITKCIQNHEPQSSVMNIC